MRALLDTNVLLDYFLARQPFMQAASELLELNAQGVFEAYISGITPINLFYVGRKEIGRQRARQAVNDLLSAVQVCPTTRDVLIQALALPFTDYEDAMQHACAVASGLDAIVTRNLGDYKNATLPIFSPTDFLQHLKTQPT